MISVKNLLSKSIVA